MFFRFHAVAVGSDRVELIYFWPRSRTTIKMMDLEGVKFIPSYRRGGYIDLPRERAFFAVLVLGKPRSLGRFRRH